MDRDDKITLKCNGKFYIKMWNPVDAHCMYPVQLEAFLPSNALPGHSEIRHSL